VRRPDGSGRELATATRIAAIAGVLAGLAIAVGARAQQPDLEQIPPYRPEYQVAGGLRIAGSELKGNVASLVRGFEKFHPDAVVSTNFMTSSEGALGMMYAGASDIAPMGDDAKITDQMPFYNTFRYLPTEISVATGGYDQRGTLFAWAIVVNKDNPITHLSMRQLDQIFGSQRSGGWEIGGPEHNLLFTARYARGAESNIRTWGQLGLGGRWAHSEIQTYGYAAPGFAVNFQRQVLHWSDKWNANFREFVEEKEATADAEGRTVSSERMLEAISTDRYAIGWAGLMHVHGTCLRPNGAKCQSYPNVKVLAISATDASAPVELTAANVRNRSYPLIRDAYIYVNRAPGRPLDPKVREFIRFVLSREGQAIIDRAGIYSPLPEAYIREQLKKID
jgi:phosphate transport system substrate-binding protein